MSLHVIQHKSWYWLWHEDMHRTLSTNSTMAATLYKSKFLTGKEGLVFISDQKTWKTHLQNTEQTSRFNLIYLNGDYKVIPHQSYWQILINSHQSGCQLIPGQNDGQHELIKIYLPSMAKHVFCLCFFFSMFPVGGHNARWVSQCF